MSNEELVDSIKNGNKAAIPQLWAQVEKLMYFICNKLYFRNKELLAAAGIDIDDFTQESYFAFLDAIEGYDESEGFKFNAYLKFPLQKRIQGFIGGKGKIALSFADSLERPLGEDLILADLVADPGNDFLPVEDKLYWEQVREDLEQGIGTLDGLQQDVIRCKYFNGLSTKDISQQQNRTYEYMRGVEAAAFRRLRRDKNLKQYWDDIIQRHAYRSSFSLWKNTGYSSTEYTALKLLDEI